MGKVGLGVLTCNREEFYKQCSMTACSMYDAYFIEDVFKEKMFKLIEEIVNENN